MSLEKILFKIEHSFSIVYVLIGGFTAFLLWASLFNIDETVRAQGKVVANGSTQIIQVADGGVLSELLVNEGDTVKEGQLLARLVPDRAQADYSEAESHVAYLMSSLARANAEILEKPIVFDKLSQAYPVFMMSQQALYIQKRRSLDENVSILKESLKLSTEEWQLTKNLQKTDDVSQLEVLRVKQKLLDIKRKIVDIKNQYYEKISKEIEKLEGELSINLHKLKKQKSVLGYTNIYSPVSGIVKELKVTTQGGVLKSGEQLMEVSPSSGVILDVKINPADIGRLEIGMPVSIKLNAFNYTVFGGLKGEVNYISSDTLLDRDPTGKEMTFYQVKVRIDGPEHSDNLKSKEIKVKLGMSGTIDVKVGQRSLFVYLTKPINRSFDGAFNEQ